MIKRVLESIQRCPKAAIVSDDGFGRRQYLAWHRAMVLPRMSDSERQRWDSMTDREQAAVAKVQWEEWDNG